MRGKPSARLSGILTACDPTSEAFLGFRSTTLCPYNDKATPELPHHLRGLTNGGGLRGRRSADRLLPRAALGVDATPGIDWIRWIISIVVAAVLVMIAASVTGGRRGRAF
jgi:hypothetical protein